MNRHRHFTEHDRDAFLAKLREMRDACIEVSRTAPIGSPGYQAADAITRAIDECALTLIGDRQHFWLAQPGMPNLPPREET